MANEFVARKGLISLQTSSFLEDVNISGSVYIGTAATSSHLTVSGSAYISKTLTVDGGITGSLYGTSSWAINALTASYALNAAGSNSTILTASAILFTGSTTNISLYVSSSGDVVFTGTNNGDIFVISDSVTPGDPLFKVEDNGATLFQVYGGGNAYLSGSLTASLNGTASYAVTASYALSYSGTSGSSGSSGTSGSSGSSGTSGSSGSSGSSGTSGAGTINGGTQYYAAIFDNATTLTTGSIYNSGSRVGINKSNPNAALDVSGSIAVTGSAFVSSSIIVPTISASYINLGTPGSGINPYITFSGSASGSIRLEVLADGSVAFIGSNGVLLGVADSLSGSLFAVNDISGFPILEVFSDDRVVMGKYAAPAITVSSSFATITGSLLGTASYALSSLSSSYAVTASYSLSYSGTSGSSGSSGTSGSSGSSGTSGSSGSSGTSGSSGSSGTSGSSGSSGTSGSSGSSGTSGTDGTSGSSGTSGTSGAGTISGGTSNYVAKFSDPTTLVTSSIYDDGTNAIITGSLYGTSSYSVNSITSSYLIGAASASYVQFDTTSSFTKEVGKLQWDSANGTLQFGMGGGNVNLQIGQEQLIYVHNAELNSIVDGEVVYAYSSQGGYVSVKRADSLNINACEKVLGIATETIGSGQFGFITNRGVVNDLNTSIYTAGDTLWLDTILGGFTNIKPTAPTQSVAIGYVTNVSDTSGRVYVDVFRSRILDDLGNVLLEANVNGDLLTYDATLALWKNSSSFAGQYTFGGITSSLAGTASYASTSLSSSYALTASYALSLSGTSGTSGTDGSSGSSGTSGTSGAGTITGGTANYVARFSDPTTLTTGSIYDDGSNVLVTGSLRLTGSLFYSNPVYNTSSLDVLVRNSTTGEIEYNIPKYLTAAKNVLRVGVSGSTGVDFTSIKAAIDSITDATSTNPYVVQVRAGKYIEDPITMKSYVAVVGLNSTATIIEARDSGSTLINGADQSMIQDVQIQGCTVTGTAAVEYKSATTPQTNAIFYVENVRFGENYTHARTVGTGGGNCIMQCSNVKYGGYPFTLGFHVTNDGSGIGRMQLRNVTSTNGGVVTTSGLVFGKADKPGCAIIVNGCLLTKAVGAAAGTGFLAYDGASLRLTAVNFQRWDKAIYIPQSGSAPSIFGSALNFENDTLDVVVEHSGSTGKLEGPDTFLKNQINFSSSLYIVNKDPRVIKVAKKGGDFSSIKSAVDYITDSTENNRYVIEVGPGAFYEQEINLVGKPYVSIVGSNIQTTEIFPSGSSQNIIKIGVNNELSFLSLTDAPVGYAAILADDIGDFGQCHKISFYNCDTNIKVIARTQDTQFYGEYVDYNGTYSYGTYASGSNGFYALVNIENYYQFPSGSTGLIANEAIGTAQLDLRASVLQGEGEANGSVALRLSDGAATEGTSLGIQDWDTGIQVLNSGNSSSFDIVGSMVHGSMTWDFDILHPNAACRYQGSADHSMINNQSNNFFWSFLDVTDGEYDITEKLSVTFADGTHTDATTLIFKGSPMGVMQGGAITISSSLTITTAAGFGYLQDSVVTSSYKRYDWFDSDLTLPADSECYIHINDAGTLQYSLSEVDFVTNIVLGRVVTNATGVEFIEQSPFDGEHTANKLSEFNKRALGSVYANGSIVTDSGSFKLNVTAGTYFFSENRFDPSGGNGITFTQYFRSASAWERSVTTTVVSDVYDSGSNVLAPLSASAYTKHTLYVVGDGVDEKYMLVVGQNEYSTLVAAENAGLPTPPTYFEYGVVPIASIYVQSGSANIVQIQDIRPVIGFKAAGVNAASVHANLIGLSSDDHKQYLLTSGVRAMDGNLNMGGFNITNASSITANSFTGSLQGTSSWANNAVTASYILNAQNATSASFAATASFIAQSGYLYSLSTSSQAIGAGNTWQELNYERNQDISGWTHVTGTGKFTSSLSAYYNIRMITSLQKASGGNQTAATRMLYNGIEVTGSYSSFTFISNVIPQEIISEATLFIPSGSGIKTEVAATANTVSIIPGVSVGSPTVRPSAKIFITKV